LLLPHEDWGGTLHLVAFVEALVRAPEEASGVALLRVERSASGERGMEVVRAFRNGRLAGLAALPDLGPLVNGKVVRADGLRLALDRWRWRDARGRAEALEQEGDWLGAEARWRSLADIDPGPSGAYASVRAAAAREQVKPDHQDVRAHLLAALGACPRLPEAALRLALWCVRHRRFADARTWSVVADSIDAEPGVPQLEGTGSWLVPERMAIAFAACGGEGAAAFAEEALRRHVPRGREPALVHIAEAAKRSMPSQPEPVPQPGVQGHG
jgi:hypothetical protein